jgi:hypothetical protein
MGAAAGGDEIARGEAPHYAVVLDRSEVGAGFLRRVRETGMRDLLVRLEAPSFSIWEATVYEFLVLWGTWGYSGGATIPVATLEALLSDGLPAAVERTRAAGGACSFILAVDRDRLPRIQQRLAELQPTSGPVM